MRQDETVFGPFVLSRLRGTLLHEGRSLPVNRLGLALLDALATAGGGVVSKASLLDAAWPNTTVEEGNLTVQIASLRKALGERSDGQEWIVTVPRVGYRLALPDEEVSGSQLPSVAVLPFQSSSGDPNEAYFANGIVDDLIAALSRFRSFVVLARSSSLGAQGRDIDLRGVAKEMGARYLLEGSIRRAGSMLRVSARLVDGKSGAHLWARNFDGDAEDVFDMQDRIVESVAALVEPKIQQAEIDGARRKRPGSFAAHDLYLQALARVDLGQPTLNTEALELLDKAIALDSRHVGALALAAHALEHRSTMGWGPLGETDRLRAMQFANRALDVDSDDAVALARCAIVLIQLNREFDRGLALLDRAVAANPNSPFVLHHASIGEILAGSLEKAEPLARRVLAISHSQEADIAMTSLAHIDLCRGQFESAADWATRSLAKNANFGPAQWILIAASTYLQRREQAKAYLAAYLSRAPGVTLAKLQLGSNSRDPRRFEVMLEGLRLAGLAER